jgi:hypothetical protein
MRTRLLPALFVALALFAAPAHADVKKEERNQVTFSGMLGKVANFFGGKATKEGIVSTVAVSGDRKMTTTGDTTGQIIDLREERIYDLDLRRKTYTVMTFEQLRQRLREAEAKARENAAKQPKEEQAPNQGKEVEVDFDIKNTGQTKTINSYDTRQVVATITVREKGRTLEQSGGLVMTVDTWLTKAVSLKEISDFDRRYFEKLAGPITAADAQQMATAMAMFPGLKEAFARLSREDFGGTAIQSTTSYRCGQECRADEGRAERCCQQREGTVDPERRSAAQSAARSAASCAGGSNRRSRSLVPIPIPLARRS